MLRAASPAIVVALLLLSLLPLALSLSLSPLLSIVLTIVGAIEVISLIAIVTFIVLILIVASVVVPAAATTLHATAHNSLQLRIRGALLRAALQAVDTAAKTKQNEQHWTHLQALFGAMPHASVAL